MPEPFKVRAEAELRRGVLQVAVLALLRTPAYGYDLLRTLNDAGIAAEEGTLYPVLRRLEAEGLLASIWDTSGSRPRKYYHTTPEGVGVLGELTDAWARVNASLNQVLETTSQADAASEGQPRAEELSG